MKALFQQSRSFLYCVAIFAVSFLLSSACLAQAKPQATSPAISPEDLKKFSGIFAEFGKVLQKTHDSVSAPLPRNHSRLLPLLPESTVMYVALPNYGEASHQFMVNFRQELQTNAELRNWWQSGEMATDGPKIEDGLEKFYLLSQYLGDEVVISATNPQGKEAPTVFVLAEVQKPGLKELLQRTIKELADKQKPAARVLDAAELAMARDLPGSDQPAILVLPDLVVASANVAALRTFNAQLESKTHDFPSTEFGRRLDQGYEGGATAVAGIDLKTILAEIPKGTDKNQAALELTGFSDAKYLIWEHKNLAGQPASQFELSFTGPRRGVVSWLTAPGPMQSLEFVSPKASVAAALLLKNPALIFDDIRALADSSNPNSSASLDQMQTALKIDLRQDLLRHLTGEITFELDSASASDLSWKVILKTDDPSHVLATLRTLFVAMHNEPVETDEEGITYHSVRIPSAQKTQEIAYAMVDSYLILAPNRESIADAAHLRHNGGSLAASRNFQAALPSGNLARTSAILYEDPLTMAAFNLKRISPELADSLAKPGVEMKPIVMSVYGDETALREVSRSQGIDIGATGVVAAIAIPNLIRARTAANESSAVAMVRTANTAQIAYASTYPSRGYARSLAVLGPDPANSNAYTPQHAGLIDASFGGPTCTAGTWCTKSGYRITLKTTCQVGQRCREYVVVATPVSSSTGTRSFCSTSDAVVRNHPGTPLDAPITASECRSWTPLQ